MAHRRHHFGSGHRGPRLYNRLPHAALRQELPPERVHIQGNHAHPNRQLEQPRRRALVVRPIEPCRPRRRRRIRQHERRPRGSPRNQQFHPRRLECEIQFCRAKQSPKAKNEKRKAAPHFRHPRIDKETPLRKTRHQNEPLCRLLHRHRPRLCKRGCR